MVWSLVADRKIPVSMLPILVNRIDLKRIWKRGKNLNNNQLKHGYSACLRLMRYRVEWQVRLETTICESATCRYLSIRE